MSDKKCRFCGSALTETLIDLGMAPLSNSYLSIEQLNSKEVFYPLHTYVCSNCFLVQLEEFESPGAIFNDYAYFSSFSDSWLEHVKKYTNDMQQRFDFSKNKLIVEIASNDGYLLQYFKEKGFPILGIEPAENVAKMAIKKGIPTIVDFFGERLAKALKADGQKADLLLGNNVLAHVPNINDFVAGMCILLNDDGIITMEFPHLLRLMKERQFDTIYHEHFSYLSFSIVEKIFNAHGLKIFDVEEFSTHGGSLRIYACHANYLGYKVTKQVENMRIKEIEFGINNIEMYQFFADKIRELKFSLLETLIAIKKQGKTIAGYGAPAKGNTLLNYCGIRTDFIDYTVDRNPHKQGKFLPGTHIPIFSPQKIKEEKPDYVLILPWNLKKEIMEQVGYIREWDGRFIIPIPKVEII
ncbi:s-adenosyl-l-methionine-dependent methyltransferase [Lucifera butyrica]|uniref:S-adenosyl-l-methionine-dependent methyltransferase n=1 Tax=Lucifera butyrica TaxID=1351585 RepID=A0A498R235_9FIRM|nr:class I SAM-dependent methyltransferase [Lucifera butyrica]VBB05524.1 s-adenosyl-l-methionine-dependent methyltransferase [Lucifera butyrica]